MLPAADANELLRQLADELENFEEIARHFVPQQADVPRLSWIDMAGGSLPLKGDVGGDHLVFVDFKKRFDLDARIARAMNEDQLEIAENLGRCRRSAGIALFDVSGHRRTDALLAAMLHGAFLVGATYELELFGRITPRLVEHLNTECYRSSASNRFVSMIYAEICEDSRFRFLSAGQARPQVFSVRHDCLMDVDPSLCMSFPPLGVQPSAALMERGASHAALGFADQYQLNEWFLMGEGDILILSTDGLLEHSHREDAYFPHRLEATLRRLKPLTAHEIVAGIKEDVVAFAPPADDISVVIIKRSCTSGDEAKGTPRPAALDPR
jgi:serine phosphatase RsbU (regulator of sigma subunit)